MRVKKKRKEKKKRKDTIARIVVNRIVARLQGDEEDIGEEIRKIMPVCPLELIRVETRPRQ